MDIQTIQPELTKYLEAIKKQVTVSGAILYGSIVEGKATESSDVDLIILSDNFQNLDEFERGKLLYRASVGFPYDLHVYGLTPHEYNTASPLTSLGQIRHSHTLRIS